MWWSSLLEHCPSEERMKETMIPPQVRMRLRTLWKIKEAKEAQIKKEAKEAHQKKKKKQKKMREKERRGNVTILLPHLCFKVAPCSSYRESLELSLSYTSGNFHYRTWLVYSDDGLPQMPEASWASKLDAHPLSFSLSFHTLIALVHPLHGNPYSSH